MRERPEASGGVVSWRDLARCDGEDPDLFFPPDGVRHSTAAWLEAEAKKVCAGCLVKSECLADAVDQDDRHAIRGGLTAEERVRAGLMSAHGGRGCGSLAGFRRHSREKEPACRPCKDAKAAYERDRAARAAS